MVSLLGGRWAGLFAAGLLTPSGEALIPVLDALLEWGKVHAISTDDPDRQHRYPPMSRLKETK